MIYKTYRATNPVRWRDGDGWQVGWRLLRDDPTAKHLWQMSGTEGFAMVSVWGSPDPIFVPESELEEMPMREEERFTSLDAKPGTWESAPEQQPVKRFEATGIEVGGGMLYRKPNGETTWHASEREELEAQVATARAEANDLMQRLTESQQEVAKLKKICVAHAEKHLADYRVAVDVERELAEVKAERDRLAAQLEASRQKHLSDAHYEGVLESVIAKVRAAIDGR